MPANSTIMAWQPVNKLTRVMRACKVSAWVTGQKMHAIPTHPRLPPAKMQTLAGTKAMGAIMHQFIVIWAVMKPASQMESMSWQLGMQGPPFFGILLGGDEEEQAPDASAAQLRPCRK